MFRLDPASVHAPKPAHPRFVDPVTHIDPSTAQSTPHVPIRVDAYDLASLLVLASLGLHLTSCTSMDDLRACFTRASRFRTSHWGSLLLVDAPLIISNHDARLSRLNLPF